MEISAYAHHDSSQKDLPDILVQLIHLEGSRQGEVDEFKSSVISIGRDPSSHVRFPADLTIVSRRHLYMP